MKLLTKTIEKTLPKLGDTDGKDLKDIKILVKFFNPVGRGTWYATEYDPEQRVFFGFAEIYPDCGELGYFSLDELESITLPFGLGIERDMYFSNYTLDEIINGKRP